MKCIVYEYTVYIHFVSAVFMLQY